ncbi:MAG: AMP-binding protein [Nitrospiraceae bacterium]
MQDAPLIGPYNPDDLLAWDSGPRTARQFLFDLTELADRLPHRSSVVNLATSRYAFLVGFGAAMLRGQVTLLPQSRAPETLRHVIGEHPDCYSMTEHGETIEGMETVLIRAGFTGAGNCPEIPRIPLEQVVAIAFTSGSTGRPTPNRKTWAALRSVACATAARLGIKGGDRRTVVATVPHQHMFGLEVSVMLPLVHGLTIHAGKPLFAEDVRSSLAEVSGKRILVTTPLHMRACLTAGTVLPPLSLMLSATAPLSRSLAQEAERRFMTKVHEIFGFAEAGSVAERRTVETDRWRLLDGVTLVADGQHWTVSAEYLPARVRFPDEISVDEEGTFIVHGRASDQLNIAGHRVSLGELNQKLLAIEGVQDGAFFLPDEGQDVVTRLMAFVVAPGMTRDQIQRMLRAQLDPAFLPRPLVMVSSLPRNATGKLPRESLAALAQQWATGKQGRTHERVLSIDVTHPSLAGHFPGHPVVPGVVLLDEVFETLRLMMKKPVMVTALPSVKFSSPLKPGEALTIRMAQESSGSATFSCHVDARLVATGTVQFKPQTLEEAGAG